MPPRLSVCMSNWYLDKHEMHPWETLSSKTERKERNQKRWKEAQHRVLTTKDEFL